MKELYPEGVFRYQEVFTTVQHMEKARVYLENTLLDCDGVARDSCWHALSGNMRYFPAVLI